MLPFKKGLRKPHKGSRKAIQRYQHLVGALQADSFSLVLCCLKGLRPIQCSRVKAFLRSAHACLTRFSNGSFLKRDCKAREITVFSNGSFLRRAICPYICFKAPDIEGLIGTERILLPGVSLRGWVCVVQYSYTISTFAHFPPHAARKFAGSPCI